MLQKLAITGPATCQRAKTVLTFQYFSWAVKRNQFSLRRIHLYRDVLKPVHNCNDKLLQEIHGMIDISMTREV